MTLPRRSGGPSTLALGGPTVVADAASEEDLARAFAALLDDSAPHRRALGQGSSGAESPSFDVIASSDLPGGGLGLSAAIGVAIARAVEALLATPPAADREERATRRALAWSASSTATLRASTPTPRRTGTFRFVRGEPARPIHLAGHLWLAVGLSGLGASTRAMVEGLARHFQ